MTAPSCQGRTARRIPAADLTALLVYQSALAEAQLSAEELQQSSRNEAAALLEAARREAGLEQDAILQQAQAQRTELLDRATEEARAIRLVEAAEAAGRLTRRFDDLTPWLGTLVLDCVERLIGEIDANRRWKGLLATALASARKDWTLRLRCHPETAADLRRIIEGDSGPDGRFAAVTEVIEDDGLAPDECLLESAAGLVEIGIAAQISALRQALVPADAPAPTRQQRKRRERA